ncbi:tRNA (adenine-N1)-methyltransferase [Sulfuracidifex metallicus]|uniref:Methyltransferase domain-containing protein n=1 Tax=Sulfuracidifex metallicus DSM 6482 = JCM 9184 TaxID=523847 RepID=A0A6A9QJJ9_SULME|nr:tRNA (adenine-N1)-methyltransferase [Sulfuracidifex metallicus]MUN28309.1 methyltransferase domain-containing protein [Sulfuracidifex metallicus DSM 6482 = JCM 9184]WOE51160.1 tRNA (adenine-N1)-methyltransferase [Sulfuracidifex metallicus DSM 6482 = JCM 9184]
MIKEGDLVVIWIDSRRIYLVKVDPQKRFSSDKGYIDMSNLIGKEYGERISLSTGREAFVLKPTPFDIYRGLKRPTQVLYPKDVAYILYMIGAKPGSTVVEAGTGSGFLTISMAYFLGESSKIITYDVRDDTQRSAKKNADFLGLADRIIFKLGDVREKIEETDIDAVFFDMPDPWNAVKSAYDSLSPSGSLVVFVPTIIQVEKTFMSMRDLFVDVHAEELMSREYQLKENAVRPKSIGVWHTGYIIYGRKSLKGD